MAKVDSEIVRWGPLKFEVGPDKFVVRKASTVSSPINSPRHYCSEAQTEVLPQDITILLHREGRAYRAKLTVITAA